MRCFIGAFVAGCDRDAFEAMRPDLAGVRWVAPEKLHLTLDFLGDIEAAELTHQLKRAREWDTRFPLACTATGVSGFPSRRRARVVIVCIDSGGVLEELVGSDDFKAHVTLGYSRRGRVDVPESSFDHRLTLPSAALFESRDGRYLPVSG